MAAGLPAGGKVEVEFTAGVWTDVSAWVESDAFTMRRGRTSEFSAPSTGSLDGLRLNNTDGRFSPLSQVLTDGSAHPYWPNVVPRKRIRYSNTPAGERFRGFVKGWPPFVDSNGTAWVMISATDWLDQGSRVTMRSPIAQELVMTPPSLSWPLTDAAGSGSALEAKRGPVLGLVSDGGPVVVFGDNGPGVGDGPGVKFAPAWALGVTSGQYLSANLNLALGAFTIECWVNAGFTLPAWAVGANENILGLENSAGSFEGLIYLFNGAPSYQDVAASVNAAASIADGGWHHIVVTRTAALSPVTLYVDGVSQGATAASTPSTSVNLLTVGESATPLVYGPARFQGNVGYVGVYSTALTAAQINVHYAAGMGFNGWMTSDRIKHWLGYAGLTAADWNIDPGVAATSTYPQDGKDVASACADMAVTEGAGAVFYVGPDGAVRFANRAYRTPAAPVMTLDAEGDLDGGAYAPSFDELTLVNSSTGSRATSSGVQSTQTWTDPISSAPPPVGYGLTTDQVTSYARYDVDVLDLIQSRVAGNHSPGFRLPQVAVDMVTAQTLNLYAALANVEIGSRIRVTNLPKAQGPSTQVDAIVEGWSETTSTLGVYQVVFDTSPADNPARGVYDDTTYGRYQCSGQTLNASLTNSATTVVIATTAGLPLFTTVGARYPLNIQVGQEVITLASAPGATSPQTFTGCTRGAVGTSAAAQAAGVLVSLFPAATYAL